MKITTVLFDLDGTLLPMEQETFVKAYFTGLTKKLAPAGYEPEKLIKAIWQGTGAMIANDGAQTNETVFWDTFVQIFGENARKDEPLFDEFYRTEFDSIKSVCGKNEMANKAVSFLKEKGIVLALATNPIFPQVATHNRIKWAGLNVKDFSLVTTYENSHYCKPNIKYYEEILKELQVKPENCLMVGNDVSEDMVAQSLGLQVFLLTENLINKQNTDISAFPNGNFEKLLEFLQKTI